MAMIKCIGSCPRNEYIRLNHFQSAHPSSWLLISLEMYLEKQDAFKGFFDRMIASVNILFCK